MNGSSTGLGVADTGSEDDVRYRLALTLFNQTAKAACDISEHKLQREAEDAAGRCVAEIERREEAARERLRRSEAVHGQNQKDAEVGAA